MEGITVKDIVEATNGTLLCGEPELSLDHISIDSRSMKGSALFVPLIGEKVDAHRFIGQALENGAAAVLTSEHDSAESLHPYIRVKDTKKALQDIGRYYRKRLSLPLIGVTGSVGKTTTREMIAAALSAGYQVYKTPGNHNSQVGVPITISEITKEDEIGVIELGMSEPGELTIIAQIARIDMAVVTNIGVTHIEQLGSRENIYREKMTIQDGLKPGGILLLNGDDDMLMNTKGREGFRTLYYGTGENCDYRAVDIRLENGYPHFMAVHGDQKAEIQLSIMGMHNVLNAMAALAAACEYGVPMEKAGETLGRFTGFKNRQQIDTVNGITVIDDTYNASPVSMKAGIDVLLSIQNPGRKIAVLADMKELGENASEFHYEVGAYISQKPVDTVAVLGELAKYIADGITQNNTEIKVLRFEEKNALKEYLDGELKAGDAVLFKGSNSMNLGEISGCYLKKKSE
ncbi:UDP-N-acetylmuramoyl-tripeptide--D-alanyl-D-alanine ligase [Clostridium sp. chh4-2]|uniref:UDP-N-acetylmuramoyl-tripeptide--D-alanyl-D- alanine ligase n=1 Tax=Clostridium sp. chh4-2 TaxID=2067550 RepID=UPI000CCE357C|nr:UDP-N-acetylmuramoyl-tripeptide--D-alanyl-D-alanine ligase [Clostridium sp. chh4-2]PNV59686.1 UDP-N-acetylmuramoyl-tripeptide--D-alanyl-D-alanine ligase [Clostridium sp. chh4-2]